MHVVVEEKASVDNLPWKCVQCIVRQGAASARIAFCCALSVFEACTRNPPRVMLRHYYYFRSGWRERLGLALPSPHQPCMKTRGRRHAVRISMEIVVVVRDGVEVAGVQSDFSTEDFMVCAICDDNLQMQFHMCEWCAVSMVDMPVAVPVSDCIGILNVAPKTKTIKRCCRYLSGQDILLDTKVFKYQHMEMVRLHNNSLCKSCTV
jgi:hypothetical protein